MSYEFFEHVKRVAASQVGQAGAARYGIISAVDPVAHAVKVEVQPEGVESGWVPDIALASGGLRVGCPAEIGTHVSLAAIEGDAEHPVITGRLFDLVTEAPTSPATGQPAQPGEMLMMAGQATPQPK